MEFRDLQGFEIECRVAQVKANGVQLLLYKNARTDSTLLDETVGAENWQDKFYECKGNLFCSVGIKTDDGWIWKDDCGSESNTEKEKGEASDAFKRACFKWGIGKPLYSSPFIWIKPDKCKIEQNGNYYKCNDKFYVKWIKYDEGKIVELLIYNQSKKCDCYGYGIKLVDDVKLTNGITSEQIEQIMLNYPNNLINDGLKKKGDIPLYSLTEEQANKFINWLEENK